MRLVLHREIPEDNTLRDQWNALVNQLERPEVFYCYEWARAVDFAFHASVKALLILGYDGDTLVGVAALAADEPQGKVFFLSGATADYCDFISSPEQRPEFVYAVFAELHRLSLRVILLANLPSDSATIAALRAAARTHGYSVFQRPGYECAQIVFATSEERKSVEQSVRTKQLRYNLKAMGKTADVQVRHSKSWNDIAESLAGFVEAHIARFLATGRISNLVRPERRAFLSELARLLARSGWLVQSRLMIGDQPVAWNYGFQFAGSWFWYQPTFDSGLQQYSPGFCLLSKIVEEACHTPGINLVDLGLGAEKYKKRLATGRRFTLHLTLTSSTIIWVKEVIRHYLASAVKAAPRLEDVARRALNQISRVRKRVRSDGPLSMLRQIWSWWHTALFNEVQIFFSEWTDGAGLGVSDSDSFAVAPLDLKLLAVAAMHYFDDPAALTYLLRSASRLDSSDSQGFVLVTADGAPVHFCWVTSFEGFQIAQLRLALKAPSPDSMLLFDCWTPKPLRGRGHFTRAISQVAARISKSGKKAWIYSSDGLVPCNRGCERPGFTPRFSLIRRRKMFVANQIQLKPLISGSTPMDAPSAA